MGMQLANYQLKQLKDLTEVNAHTEAYELGARMIRSHDLADRIAEFKQRHIKAGGLDPLMRDEQYALYTELKEAAKKAIPCSEAFNKFYMCF